MKKNITQELKELLLNKHCALLLVLTGCKFKPKWHSGLRVSGPALAIMVSKSANILLSVAFVTRKIVDASTHKHRRSLAIMWVSP